MSQSSDSEKKNKKETKKTTKKDNKDTKTGPLSGCKIFIDVSLDEKIGIRDSVAPLVEKLGGTVSKTLVKTVTHCIFKDPSAANLKKAESFDTPAVDLKWLKDCEEQDKLVPIYGHEVTLKRKQSSQDGNDAKKKKSQETTVPSSPVSKMVQNELIDTESELEDDELDGKTTQEERVETEKWIRSVAGAKYIIETSQIDPDDKDILLSFIDSRTIAQNASLGDDYHGEPMTHLVAGDDKRVLKIIAAIAYGAKILDPSWIMACIEKGDFVDDDEKFLKSKWNETIAKREGKFLSRTNVCIMGETNPEHATMERLVVACGGKIVQAVRTAHVCIAGFGAPKSACGEGLMTVNGKWLFDSICQWKMLEDPKYNVTKEDCEKWQPKIAKKGKKSKDDFEAKAESDEEEGFKSDEEEDEPKKKKTVKKTDKPKKEKKPKAEKKEKTEKKPKEKKEKKEKDEKDEKKEKKEKKTEKVEKEKKPKEKKEKAEKPEKEEKKKATKKDDSKKDDTKKETKKKVLKKKKSKDESDKGEEDKIQEDSNEEAQSEGY